MDTRSYTTIDRTGWPSGPWDNEPDKVQWPDAATGLPCLAVRNPIGGHWCGYVGVPPGHPNHGRPAEECDNGIAHGGLNFAATCNPNSPEGQGVCHVPATGEPADVWWLGFDCAHSGDGMPGWQSSLRNSKYRKLSYVQRICTELAHAFAAEPPHAS